MDQELKTIVEQLGLSSWKEDIQNNRVRMSKLKNKMSKLTFHIEVAEYAYILDELFYFSKEFKEPSEEQIAFVSNRMKKLKQLEKKERVRSYMLLRKEYQELEKMNNQYYQTLLINFPEQLESIDTPNIYIYQGTKALPRHIIFREKFGYPILYPRDDSYSNRELRHFYNQIHFRYLDTLTETKDFEETFQKVRKQFKR